MGESRKSNSKAEGCFVIENKLGLHARAASQFVVLANKFKSDILVEKDGKEVSGKSIMGIMMLAAANGSRITIRARGSDAQEAVDGLGALIKGRFGEE